MWIRSASLVLLTLLGGCSLLTPRPVPADTASTAAQPLPDALISAYQHGLVLLQGEDADAALAHWHSLSGQWPEYPGVWSNLALSHRRLQQYGDGLAAAQQALQVQDGFCPALKVQALLLRDNGRFRDAEGAYQQAMACDPQDAALPYNLGILYDLYLQDLSRALDYYRQAQVLLQEEDSTLAMWITDLQNRQTAQLAGEGG